MTDKLTLPSPLFPKDRLRNASGTPLTQALFYEYRHQCPDYTPIYNLKWEEDCKGTISMYRVYMESASEYEAAVRLLGSWKHWLKLCDCTWFNEYLEEWREEKAIQEKAIGKATLIAQAKAGNVNAARILDSQKISSTKKKGKEDTKKLQSARVNDKVTNLLERMNVLS